ncbi:MAG: hypothetical protein O2979_10755 [Proteobacteria bacterium]|nr:hypothetical protein [Pseudomonadota bacterium]
MVAFNELAEPPRESVATGGNWDARCVAALRDAILTQRRSANNRLAASRTQRELRE